MKENKTMDEIHRGLLKKFHTLCSLLGMTDDEKRALIDSYGVESSRDIDTHDLVDICGTLSAQVNEKQGNDIDKLRKRCMAAIGAWLKAAGKYQNAAIIKGIACVGRCFWNYTNSILCCYLWRLYSFCPFYGRSIFCKDSFPPIARI